MAQTTLHSSASVLKTGQSTLPEITGMKHIGKHHAFLAVIEPLLPSLERFARSMVRSRADAEDLVADAVLVAYQKYETLTERNALLSYLFTTIRNALIRKHRRSLIFSEYDDEIADTVPTRELPPDELADVTLIRQAMEKLPFEQKETIILFEISGLSLEEIRVIQGGSLSGVKSRLVRAREKLKSLLGEQQR